MSVFVILFYVPPIYRHVPVRVSVYRHVSIDMCQLCMSIDILSVRVSVYRHAGTLVHV